MGKYFTALALVFILTTGFACAKNNEIKGGLRAMVGQNVDVAVSTFGKPDKVINRQTHNIYIWDTGSRRPFPDEFNSQGPNPGHGSDVANEVVFGENPAYGCAIKLRTNSDDVIRSWDFESGLSSCDEFAKQLKL